MSSISVIIPLYNAEKFVRPAYGFICEQQVELPLEIIFVDNNSKDNSLNIARAIASEDKRVKVFQEKVQGAPSARNKGFDESSGDFVYFFDVDDQLFETTLKDLSDVLLADPSVDAVFGKMLKSNKHIREVNRDALQKSDEIIFRPKPYWGLRWFKDLSTVVGPPAFLYRRETFFRLGKYDPRLSMTEDTALDILLGMTSKIAFIDKYIYIYFKHGNSSTDFQKKSKSRNFIQWPRLTLAHLPYHLQNPLEEEFGRILKQKIYSSIPKMIVETKGLKARQTLKKKLIQDISPLTMPLLLALFINVLVIFPNDLVLKLYIYRILKFYKK